MVPLYVTVVMILLGVSGELLVLSTSATSRDDFFFTAVILELFVYTIPAAFYCRIRGLDFVKASGLRVFSPSDVPFILSVFLVYALGTLFLLYMGFAPSDAADMNLTLRSVPETDSFFVALCYVVIPAVAEETLFRNLLLHEYKDFKGVFSLIITSLFFAMIHFSFEAILFYFWGGLTLGLLTIVTRSSLPAVILHMLSNFASLYFSDTISGFLNSAENSVVLIFLMSTLFVLALYFLVSSMQTLYEKKSEQYEMGSLAGCRVDTLARLTRAGRVDKTRKHDVAEQGTTPRDMFLSPTVLLAVCVFIFITLGVI